MKQSSRTTIKSSLSRTSITSKGSLSRVRLLWISLTIPICLILYMNFAFVSSSMTDKYQMITSNRQQQQQKKEDDHPEKPAPSSYTYPFQLHYVNPDGTPTKQGTPSPPQLISSPNTVVTAYFSTRSKQSGESYNKWMANMLALQDAMIIYTQPSMVNQMLEFRQHASNRTVVVSMEMQDLPMAKLYDTKVWEHQFDMDYEKRIHRSYQLFWIWLSKTWYVVESITTHHNPFKSDVFMYSDIGCFRGKNQISPDKPMIQHREVIPRHAMLQLAHHAPNPPPNNVTWWNDKRTQKEHFYHSGSQMVAFQDTWVTFHKYFMETVDGFIQRDMFVGEDQAVLQSTCLQHPDICEYISFDQVPDNHYFGLRTVVHKGGTYKKWKPPSVSPQQ